MRRVTAKRFARSVASSMAFGKSTPRRTSMPWMRAPCARKARGDGGIGVGLVPHLAREERRLVLMTRDAHRARGVDHRRPSAGAIVAHDLEFEAARGLVVADDLEQPGRLLIADEEPILRAQRTLALARHRDHGARTREEVRRRRAPLQRASERNQHAVHAALVLGAADLPVELAQQRLEGKRDAVGRERIEQRAARGRQVRTGLGRIDRPLRRRRGAGHREHQRHGEQRTPDHFAATTSERACVPPQQSSAALPVCTNAGPSRSAMIGL